MEQKTICAVVAVIICPVIITWHKPDTVSTPAPTSEPNLVSTSEPTQVPTPAPTLTPIPATTPEPTAVPTPEISNYQAMSIKCIAYDASVELPMEIEMLDQTVIRYVKGSHPNSSSGGMYLCRKPGESGIRVVKPRSPVTVLAVRGSLENSTGYAFVETTDAEYGWIRIGNNGLVPDPF